MYNFKHNPIPATVEPKAVLANLQFARSVIDAYPATQIDLANYKLEREEHTCGSLFCGLGLLATIPKFKALGFATALAPASFYGEGNKGVHSFYLYISPSQRLCSTDVADAHTLDPIFGVDAFQTLFLPRMCNRIDPEIVNVLAGRIGGKAAHISDKDLLLARFDLQIAKYQ